MKGLQAACACNAASLGDVDALKIMLESGAAINEGKNFFRVKITLKKITINVLRYIVLQSMGTWSAWNF